MEQYLYLSMYYCKRGLRTNPEFDSLMKKGGKVWNACRVTAKREIAALIGKLAVEDYKVRAAAAARLSARGLTVLPALRRAARDKDPERSLTAEHLLRKLTPPWWKGK